MRLSRSLVFGALSFAVANIAVAQVPVIDAKNLAERQQRDAKTTSLKETQSDASTIHASVSCSMYKKAKGGPLDAAAQNPEIAGLVKRVAREEGVDEPLFLALVYQESGFYPCARSGKNAYGLTQLLPGTAADMRVNPHNIEENLRGGARFFKQQLRTFHGDQQLALAAYNSGPGNVQKYGGIPPFKETRGYVANITQKLMPAFGGSSSSIPINYGGGGTAISQMQQSNVNALASSQATSESLGNISAWYQQMGSTYTGTIQDSWDLNSGVRNANSQMMNKLVELTSIFADLLNNKNTLTVSGVSGSTSTTGFNAERTEQNETDRKMCGADSGLFWDAHLSACVKTLDPSAALNLKTNP